MSGDRRLLSIVKSRFGSLRATPLAYAGEFLSSGASAEVYAHRQRRDRVIKLSRVHVSMWDRVRQTLEIFRRYAPKGVCKIYEIAPVGTSGDDSFYCTVLERMTPRENSIHEVGVAEAVRDVLSVEDVLGHRIQVRLAPDSQRLLEAARSMDQSHADLHDGNVMRDSRGRLALVDHESFEPRRASVRPEA